MSELGIANELAAQLDVLLREKQRLETEVRRLKSSFTGTEVKILSQAPLKVVGIAIGEGVWNGVVYPKEELRKAFERIKNKRIPVNVEHGRSPKYGNKIVGETEKWEWNETLGAILAVARIDDPEAIQDLQKHELKGYSLEVLPNEAWDTYVRLAKDIDFKAISLTKYPAVEFALIVRREELLSSLLNTSDSASSTMSEEKKETAPEEKQATPTKSEPVKEERVEPKTEVTKPEVADKVKELETVVKELITRLDKQSSALEAIHNELKSLKEAKQEAPKEAKQEAPVEAEKEEPSLEEIKKEFESKPLGEVFFAVKTRKKSY